MSDNTRSTQDWVLDETSGRVELIRPLSSLSYTGFAAIAALLLVLFALFGTYTKHTRLSGVLLPEGGVVKVSVQQPSEVVQRLVDEGSHVKQGDVLFVLSTESYSDVGGAGTAEGANAAILKTLNEREGSLKDERTETIALDKKRGLELRRKLDVLTDESSLLKKQIEVERERVSSAEKRLGYYQELEKKKIVSPLDVLQKADDLSDRKVRYQALLAEQVTNEGNVASVQSELEQIDNTSKVNQAQISRQISVIRELNASVEAHRTVVIKAPRDGVVTAVLAAPGQFVANQTLLTIVPSNVRLVAELYAPSRSVGLLETGQAARLRYSSFPYQKFGQYRGRVVSVSHVALPPSEMQSLLGIDLSNEKSGLYRVSVDLDEQNIVVSGQPHALVAGMVVDADILQSKRTLISWLMEPLYWKLGR